MVGMGVGLKRPDDIDALVRRTAQDPLNGGGARLSIDDIVVEDRIDDGGFPRYRIADEIADRVRGLVEKGFDFGL